MKITTVIEGQITVFLGFILIVAPFVTCSQKQNIFTKARSPHKA